MSDTMLFGVLKMPYEMAMRDEISRIQFYQRVQQLVDRVEAQPQQEPVISEWSLREVYFDDDGEPLMHRSPPAAQRPWQGLTASTILNLMPSSIPAEYDGELMEFARAVEAKLKDRNGY
jgi:hypothetical protein